MFRSCARGASRRNKIPCRGLSCGNHTHNDTYAHAMILDEVTRIARATCWPFPMVKQTLSSNMSAFGRGASVLGGWRLGGFDAVLLNMKPFYVN